MLPNKLYKDAIISGPYFYKGKGRWYVSIRFSNGDRYRMHYARYLMQEHLGRELLISEEVDHMDDNKVNDVISNLQILTSLENSQKSNQKYFGEIEEVCFDCEEPFVMDSNKQREWKKSLARGCIGPFCSRTCANRYRNRR